MKHFLLIGLCLFMVSPAFAESANYYHQGLYFELGGGKNLGDQSEYNPTPAGTVIDVGYSFDPQWSAQLQWIDLTWESKYTIIYTTEDRILPEIKWTPFIGVVQPYALAGVGMSFQTVTDDSGEGHLIPPQNYSYFDMMLGAGAHTNFKSFINIFVEAHCNVIFVTSGITASTVPLFGGIQLDI